MNDRSRVLVPLMLTVVFIVSRLAIFFLWLRPEANFVANDVSYYGYHLHQLELGNTAVMQEYPPPAVWLLHLVYRVGGGWQTWFPVYAATMAALDFAVAASFHRRSGAAGALFWILFTGANGAIVWFRFDLLPAALVAWACLWIARRPAVSGALIGAGAAIKLWPAILIFPMLAPDPRHGVGLRRLGGFVAVGGALAAVSLAIHGWSRNLAPLRWQAERGLQIESVPATPLMFLRTFTDNPSWSISLSEFNALEIFGPGVDAMLVVSQLLTVASFALALAGAILLVRRKADTVALLFVVLTVVLATIVANKTLSPQYILWLGGPVAALLIQVRSPVLRRHVHVIAVTLVLVGGLTQYTYPWGAFGIMAMPLGSGPETSVLILRNLILVALTGYSCWLSVKASTPSPVTIG